MLRILVDIDTQNDFCEPGGAWPIPGAPDRVEVWRALVRDAVDRERLIVGTVDTHRYDSREFRTVQTGGRPGPFAPHCVKGTRGWLKVEGTLAPRAHFVPSVGHECRLPSGCHAIYFEKDALSLLANPVAESVLRDLAARAPEPPTFSVFGVATDYCVKLACQGLLSLKIGRVELIVDAVAAVVPEDGERAIDRLMKLGLVRIRSADLLGQAADP